MKSFRFHKFKVYKDAQKLEVLLLRTLKTKQIAYYLKDQVERAMLSVRLNIAEGSAKKSDKEFARFLEISLGSINEVVAGLETLQIKGIITKKEHNEFLNQASEIARQLGGFIKFVRSES